jgi:NAD(P)-dependent dehydrogenase (short-subunit alcohol dehydrogenase family)
VTGANTGIGYEAARALAHKGAEVILKDFLDMLRTFPDLTFRVTKLIGFRLRTFRNRVEGLLFKGTAARLAQTLADFRRRGLVELEGRTLRLREPETLAQVAQGSQ